MKAGRGRTMEERPEPPKPRLNASNIVREEMLSHSFHSRREPNVSYAPDPSLSLKHTLRVEDVKSRVEKELNYNVSLATEKKQLTLLLEDQAELQARIRSDFARQIDSSRSFGEQHERAIADLAREVEAQSERMEKRADESAHLESELTSFAEENRNLENEIKRLGEKTANKITEMQGKLQSGLADLQGQKERHEQELEKLNQFSAEKIRRAEEELAKKALLTQEKYNDVLEARQESEAELLRLQDTKRRAETELEEKIKAVKQEFYDEDHAQFTSIYRIAQNRLRIVTENKEQQQKRYAALLKEMETLNRELERNEREISSANGALDADIRTVREETTQLQIELEQVRNRHLNDDAAVQRTQAEIGKAKFAFKQMTDNSKYKIKDLIEKCSADIRQHQLRVNAQMQRNKESMEELDETQKKFKAVEVNAQRMVGNMRSQLNHNIQNTIKEHKEISPAATRDSVMRSPKNYY